MNESESWLYSEYMLFRLIIIVLLLSSCRTHFPRRTDCAHGHICCNVGCPCCMDPLFPELNPTQNFNGELILIDSDSRVQTIAEKDSFHEYKSRIEGLELDSVVITDSTWSYDFKYQSSCSYHQGVQTKEYLNNTLICTANADSVGRQVRLSTDEKGDIHIQGSVVYPQIETGILTMSDLKSNISYSFDGGNQVVLSTIVITEHGGQSRGYCSSSFLERIQQD